MKRLITYDIIKGNDYSKLYEFIEKYKGIQITESTYEVTCSLSLEVFKQEIKQVIRNNDKVYVISIKAFIYENYIITLNKKSYNKIVYQYQTNRL